MKRSAKVVLTLLGPAMAAFGCEPEAPPAQNGMNQGPVGGAGEFNSEFAPNNGLAPATGTGKTAIAGGPRMTAAVGDIPALPVNPGEGAANTLITPGTAAAGGAVVGAVGANLLAGNAGANQLQVRNLIQYVDAQIQAAWQKSPSTAIADLRRAQITVEAWNVDKAIREQQAWRLINTQQQINAGQQPRQPRRSSGGLFAWFWPRSNTYNSSSSYGRSSYSSNSWSGSRGSTYGGSQPSSYSPPASTSHTTSGHSTSSSRPASSGWSWGGGSTSSGNHSSSSGHVSHGGFGSSSGHFSGGS